MDQESSRSFRNNNIWNLEQKSPRNSRSPRLNANPKKDHSGFQKKKSPKKQGEQPSSQKKKNKGNNDSDDDIKMINESMVQLEDPKFITQEIDSFEQNLSKNIRNKQSIGFCQETRKKSLLLSNTQGYRKYKNEMKNEKQRLSQSKLKEIDGINNKKDVNIIKQQTQDKIKMKNGQQGEQQQRKIKDEQNKSSTSLAYSNDSRQRMRIKLQKKQQKSIENNSFASVLTINNDNNGREENKKQQKHITKHVSF